MKRFKLLMIMLSGMLVLTSCGLLPEEETFRTAPVIKTYEKEEFNQTVVVRGDMELTNKITCNFVPMQTENLSFSVGGEFYDEIFVSEGDRVEKGELLAQLDLSGAEEAIENCTPQINRLEMQITALEENRALELERQKILLSDGSEEALNEALERTNRQFDAQKQPLEDQLTVAQIQLREAKALLSERQIRAGFDGTVTFVRSVEEEERNIAGDRVVTVADTSTSLFKAETKYWDSLKPGDEYIITANKREYEAVVVSEAELGIEETEKQEGEMEFVYLKLKKPALDLDVQTFGSFNLLRDSRKNVLMVPESAVSTSKGQSIVYYQDEAGLKAYKQVEIGLVAEGMVEIVSGLTEGERVIVK